MGKTKKKRNDEAQRKKRRKEKWAFIKEVTFRARKTASLAAFLFVCSNFCVWIGEPEILVFVGCGTQIKEKHGRCPNRDSPIFEVFLKRSQQLYSQITSTSISNLLIFQSGQALFVPPFSSLPYLLLLSLCSTMLPQKS